MQENSYKPASPSRSQPFRPGCGDDLPCVSALASASPAAAPEFLTTPGDSGSYRSSFSTGTDASHCAANRNSSSNVSDAVKAALAMRVI